MQASVSLGRHSKPLLISAAGSGGGKTTVCVGMVRALVRRGHEVRVAKCGPDFLDPAWLSAAARRPCLNLDPWMMGEENVLKLAEAESRAGLLLVEGVMGLYDGAEPESDEGSSAHVARLLGAEVLLVVDAAGCARTFAAIVHGLTDFGKLPVLGVVANRTGSDRHADLLARALSSCGLPPLIGHIPKGAVPELSSRHLGLLAPGDDAALERLADAIEAHIDLSCLFPEGCHGSEVVTDPVAEGPLLAVAFDEAFGFLYQDTLDALRRGGVRISWTSPLRDASIPVGAQGLWIPGGYPEEHAADLARNKAWLDSLRDFCQSGRPVLAECGGMMLLARSVTDRNGATHALGKVLPARAKMGRKIAALGYVEVELARDSFLGLAGDRIRGHEFHYGSLCETPDWETAFGPTLQRGRSEGIGWMSGNTIASWTHLHLGSRPKAIQTWITHLEGALPWPS